MTRSPALLATLLGMAALLSACNASGRPSYPMASGQDRTFSVPVYGNQQAQAHATAQRQCSKIGLFPRVLRDEGHRIVFECVSEASPDSRP